jgi:hypothetical protein
MRQRVKVAKKLVCAVYQVYFHASLSRSRPADDD